MDAASTGPTVRGPRRPRISLRAMLVVVLFLGCSLGWLVHRARVQRAAVDSVERVRGEVLYEWEYKDGKYIPGGRPWWPRWLVSALGVDYLGSVVRVFVTQDGSDAVLDKISGLARLEELIFTSSSPSDGGLARLGGLTGLRYLDLSKSGVTDAGLSHIGTLTGLRCEPHDGN
jgi:internalin A